MLAQKSKKLARRTARADSLSGRFKRLWDSDVLRNAEHRIDQTIQHFINVESANFYEDREELINEIERFCKREKKRPVPKEIRTA